MSTELGNRFIDPSGIQDW
uniref:Uncharacterized protein n=1 Tax=Rhizophora mucronata TaxID=61149 RepID=A0A2P2PJ13_RHIMU